MLGLSDCTGTHLICHDVYFCFVVVGCLCAPSTLFFWPPLPPPHVWQKKIEDPEGPNLSKFQWAAIFAAVLLARK
jgi:hypothetical protein